MLRAGQRTDRQVEFANACCDDLDAPPDGFAAG
jgi:hypothetical protein